MASSAYCNTSAWAVIPGIGQKEQNAVPLPRNVSAQRVLPRAVTAVSYPCLLQRFLFHILLWLLYVCHVNSCRGHREKKIKLVCIKIVKYENFLGVLIKLRVKTMLSPHKYIWMICIMSCTSDESLRYKNKSFGFQQPSELLLWGPPSFHVPYRHHKSNTRASNPHSSQ